MYNSKSNCHLPRKKETGARTAACLKPMTARSSPCYLMHTHGDSNFGQRVISEVTRNEEKVDLFKYKNNNYKAHGIKIWYKIRVVGVHNAQCKNLVL